MTTTNTTPELTAKQIKAGWEHTFSTNNPFCPCDLKSFTKAVNWAERALAATAPNAAAPYRSVVEVCPECDIADCRHIRERRAPNAGAPLADGFDAATARAERIEEVAAKYASRTEFGEVIFPAQSWMMFAADLATEAEAAPPTSTTMQCEDCNGHGVVGDEIPQGEFQPPERERCESCDGTGRWVITPPVTQEQHDAAIAQIQDAFEEDDAAPAQQAGESILAEHSGCGSGKQSQQVSAGLNPGDQIILRKGRITLAIEQAQAEKAR